MDRPAALHFINTTHPGDATTSSSLSQIRSHAQKEIRLRARRLRKAAPPQGKKGDTKRIEQLKQNTDGKRGDTAVSSINITSSNSQEAVEEPTSTVPSMALSRSPQAIGLSSVAPCGGFSEKEGFLLLHYVNYVIPFSNGSCHKNRNSSSRWLIDLQLKHWIPLALSDRGLMAALFLQSCHSLGVLNPHQDYADMSTKYRLQCIQSTNASLATTATQMSDATIAKVMIMAIDEFTIGNVDAWRAHLAAITWMIERRGGVDALGVGGFLKEVIVNTPIFYE
ncbi:transcriptional regulator family: Fungal Specific TF [Trichoderma aggressivum f. europaeum]|uniref:Transcriptional regulator family: Fungal Specific TF n=1 Tax=Trichoderma aggressivum f. europaeum TaxID=173218 RepID=A0AAE1I729_9HYPO|nr:transcriptional regulator family: Fungal Specific TF [Trichoderma aggressivum f. europaeum]